MESVFSNPGLPLSVGPSQNQILSVAELLDPRLDVRSNEEKLHVVFRGPTFVDEEIYPSNSFGLQQATWAQNTTSITDVTEKDWWMKHYVQFDFKDALLAPVAPFGVTGIPTNPVYDGPRSWPIQSCTQTMQLKLNGQNFSVNPQEYLHAQLRYHVSKDDIELDYSTFPSMEDTVISYNDAILYGSGRNPFGGINECASQMTRNALQPVAVLNAGSTLQYEFTEPLYISPLNVARKLTEGLTSLNRWEITLQWGNLSRMWSTAGPPNSPVSSVTVTFYKAPEIVLRFLKRTRRMEMSRPMSTSYPYFRPFQFVKSNVNLPAFVPQNLPGSPGSTVVSSDSIQFNQIPNGMLIFLRKAVNSATINDTDTFARILNISVFFNGIRVLSNANEQQIYLMCKKNGYNQSFAQWRNLTGSVLFLKFGEDVGLEEGVAPGMMIQRTIQIQVTAVNLQNIPVSFDYYLLPIFSGSIQIQDDACQAYDGILTADMVARAVRSPSLSYCQYRMYEQLNGAGLYDSLKHVINKGAKIVGKVARVAERIAPPQYQPYIQGIKVGADILGNGYGGAYSGGRR